MHKIITIYKKLLFVLFLLVLPAKSLFGQTITLNPLPFTEACAGLPDALNSGQPFNWFDVDFTLTSSPSPFPPGSTFEVVLSDANGSFASPVLAIASSVPLPGSTPTTNGQSFIDVTSTQKKIRFGLPSNPPLPGGTNYRLQVQCVQNTSILGRSPLPGFSGAYQSFNQAFFINGGAPTAGICGVGNSLTLSVDPNSVANPSPIIYPSLKYKWFKDGVLISGQTGSSIVVSAAGVYYAQIDYGSCSTASSVTKSQPVTVSIIPSGATFSISPPSVAPICGGTDVTLSTAAGYNYQWKRDGVNIGTNSFQLITSLPGTYTVDINAGSCSGLSANSVTITTQDITASLNVLLDPFYNTIVAGGSINVVATTDATGPVNYEWFKGTTSVQSGPSNSFLASIPDRYKVRITGDKGTCTGIVKELVFNIKEGINIKNIPNVISPNNDGINDTWMLPQEYINNTTTEIKIINTFGDVVLSTNNYQNDWPSSPIDFTSVNPVYYYTISKDGQEVKGSITVVK